MASASGQTGMQRTFTFSPGPACQRRSPDPSGPRSGSATDPDRFERRRPGRGRSRRMRENWQAGLCRTLSGRSSSDPRSFPWPCSRLPHSTSAQSDGGMTVATGSPARRGRPDRPILDAQAGDAAEVTPVASDDHSPILQRNGGDAQVHKTNVELEGLELCDLRDGRFRVGEDAPTAQTHDGLAEMRAGSSDLFRSAGLPRQRVPTRELLIDRHDRNR